MAKLLRRMRRGLLIKAMSEYPPSIKRQLGLHTLADIQQRAEELLD